MWARLSVFVVVLVGCVQTDAVQCGDGLLCPSSTQCRALTNPDQEICATDDQIQRCNGKAQLDDCSSTGDASERCYDGVCLPAGCGNGRLDPGEVCDDGNDIVGDGCSASCMSNETCGNGIVDPIKLDAMGHGIPNEQCDDKNRLAHDGCSNNCLLETLTWTQIPLAPPPIRDDAKAVFDSARRRIVMYGGERQSGQVDANAGEGDTWEWDGTGWTAVFTAASPGPRGGVSLAYDSDHHRVLLFGGTPQESTQFSTGGYRDTWTFDGSQWFQLSTANAPPARYSAGAAYDTKRHVMVIYGGIGDDLLPLGDTWEFDGTDWKEITNAGPPPTAVGAVAMTYDPKRAVVVVAGGKTDGTWEYDGTWRDVTPPLGMRADLYTLFQLAYDPAIGKVIGFGGRTAANAFNANTWSWDGTVWQKVATTGITARANTMLVGDPLHGNTIAFGGYNNYTCGMFTCRASLNDTYVWNGTWTAPSLPAWPAHYIAASTLDVARGVVVMFGGTNGSFASVNDTWELRNGHWTQMTPGAPPSLRSGPAMAWDGARNNTVLFGGLDSGGSTFLADTEIWNGSQWSSVFPLKSPPGRAYHMMAYDPVRKKVVLFGGEGMGFAFLNDTWEWDGTNWAQVATTGPGPRYLGNMTWDPVRQRVLLTGGGEMNNTIIYRDTWEWDGTTWTQLDVPNAPHPGGRTDTSIAWSATTGRLELFGGRPAGGVPFDDTWSWDGQTWSAQLPIASAPARSDAAMQSSPAGDGVVVFGGVNSGAPGGTVVYADEWLLRYTSADLFEACSLADLDSDGDGLAGCADPDCWTRCTPFCPPGLPCDTSLPHCGDGTCSPVEDCRLCPVDCGACTAVCGDGICDAGETGCAGDCP